MSLNFIAEVGSNWYHPEYPYLTQPNLMREIQSAGESGANVVKFQVFAPDTLYSRQRAPDLYERVKPYEFPVPQLSLLQSLSKRLPIKTDVWASIFSPLLVEKCVDSLDGLKVASGDITYYELLDTMAYWSNKKNIPLGISTGAATKEEIEIALDRVEVYNPYKLILFHCVSAYPADPLEMNLRSGMLFKDRVSAIGLSDHTLDFQAGELAVALGYTYFEKHFRHFEDPETSPDYVVSLNPDQFREFRCALGDAELILGTGQKRVNPSEVNERRWARRGTDGLRPAF